MGSPRSLTSMGSLLHVKYIGLTYRNPRGGDIDIRLCKKMTNNDKNEDK